VKTSFTEVRLVGIGKLKKDKIKFDKRDLIFLRVCAVYLLSRRDTILMNCYHLVLRDLPLGTTSEYVISITKILAISEISHWRITSNGKNGGINIRTGLPTKDITSTGSVLKEDAGNESLPLKD
jgi:hypothetical protein